MWLLISHRRSGCERCMMRLWNWLSGRNRYDKRWFSPFICSRGGFSWSSWCSYESCCSWDVTHSHSYQIACRHSSSRSVCFPLHHIHRLLFFNKRICSSGLGVFLSHVEWSWNWIKTISWICTAYLLYLVLGFLIRLSWCGCFSCSSFYSKLFLTTFYVKFLHINMVVFVRVLIYDGLFVSIVLLLLCAILRRIY